LYDFAKEKFMAIDQNVEEVRAMLAARAIVGFKKYGCNTTRQDLTTEQWLQHLQEELMDACIYIQRLKKDVESLTRPDIKINSYGVAVDQTRFWMPMETCPKGVKVQLLTASGVAVYGKIGDKNKEVFEGWAALPKKP
jgi:hypothetical protein